MTTQITLPKLLAEKYKKDPTKVALRQKDLGIWNEVTWEEYYRQSEKIAIMFSDMCNLESGDKVVIIGENRPQWLMSEMAIQVLGGVAVGVYQESSPSQIAYYINDTKTRVVVAEDQEQVDKILEIEDDIPLVEHIVYYNPQGMQHYNNPKLVYWQDLIDEASDLLKNNKDYFYNKAKELSGDRTAVIAYSAGSTGEPKGIKLTHTNLISAAENLIKIDNMSENDDYLSFLPLAWINEQVMSIVIPLHTGNSVNFPEKPSTVLGDLREIGPHTMLAPPRVFQTLLSSVTTRINSASRLKRWIYKTFKRHGDKVAEASLNGKNVSGWTKFMNFVGDWLVFSAIRDHLGLSRIKRVYLAGATLNREAYYFFRSIGVNLKQTYGGTELAGIAFVHQDNDIRFESAGKPLPGTEVKVNDNGEVFIKNEQIFSGYIDEDDQAEVKDGWFTLGDCGYISEEGHLVILDRMENIIEVADGGRVYPSLVENKLKVSPYIREAIVFGRDREYLTAIVNIDFTNIGRWADSQNIGYTTYGDLALREEVLDLIQTEVNELSKKLPEKARVHKYVVLSKPFSANDGELTRTLKIRRKFVTEKYEQLINELYTDKKKIEITIGNGKVPEKLALTVLKVNTDAKGGA